MTRFVMMIAFGVWCFCVGAMMERGNQFWLLCLILAVAHGVMLFVNTADTRAGKVHTEVGT